MNAPTLERQQEVVRLYAYPKMKKWRIDPARVEIFLSNHLNSSFAMVPGHTVKLTFKTPEVFDFMNSWLDDALRLIQRLHAIRSMDLVPYNYHRDIKGKLAREAFGDMAEVILDLIPKTRLKVTKTEIITLEDTKTGEKVSMSKESVDKMTNDNVSLWLDLSRRVRDKDASTIYLVDEV
jgi:hypothetical protein